MTEKIAGQTIRLGYDIDRVEHTDGIVRFHVLIADRDTKEVVCTVVSDSNATARLNFKEIQRLIALLSDQPNLERMSPESDQRN